MVITRKSRLVVVPVYRVIIEKETTAASVCLFLTIFLFLLGNLPDPGKAQDFVKKLAQVLEEDEKIRKQLETLVSPTCSCKQAEVCVVRTFILALCAVIERLTLCSR